MNLILEQKEEETNMTNNKMFIFSMILLFISQFILRFYYKNDKDNIWKKRLYIIACILWCLSLVFYFYSCQKVAI